MFQNAGDTNRGISVTVSTSAAVRLYTSDSRDREIMLQNPSTSYFIFVATYAFTSTSSGPRATIPRATTERYGEFVTNATADIWGLLESAAGSVTQEVLGWAEKDSRD